MATKIEFLLWSLFVLSSLMAYALDGFNRDYLIMGLLGGVTIKLVIIQRRQSLDTSPQNEALRKELKEANEDARMLAEDLELEQNPGYICDALRAHYARVNGGKR